MGRQNILPRGFEIQTSDGVQKRSILFVSVISIFDCFFGRKVVEADAVVMAVGVVPDIILAKEAGLELNGKGTIKVDANYRTSDPNIYAVDDAIEVYNGITGQPMQLPLAGPVQKQARQAASILMNFDQNVAK